MAINKARTSPLMKTLIIILAASFVLSIGFAGIGSIPGCSAGPILPQPDAGTTTDNTASVETTAQLAAQYTSQIASLEASITADPKNYDLLVAQGENYLGWALQYATLTNNLPDTSSTVWASAISYFDRAIKIKATDGPLLGDYAMALFYSGDTTAAITAGEKSRVLDPTGAQNLYNLGNYYSAAGDKAKALESYQACLTVNNASASPNADLATAAQTQITALGGQ
jgi:tetratricopeptide (TPR) repeat protein